MKIDSTTYSGRCVCGREHHIVTQAVVLEPGCLYRLEEFCSDYHLQGRRCALYDTNSFAAVADRRPHAEQEIVLYPDNLHADETSTALVLEKLETDIDLLFAVGSGTIHDIARFCAWKRKIPFVSLPTAASMDGYCSTVASMTWHGYKKAITAAAPVLVAADLDIIQKAPPRMIRSGVGDILAKYIAQAEWKIAHLVTGEYFCPRILEIMRRAADAVVESVPGILEEKETSFEKVTYALVMSGIAMQMMGNSRPASGAEHHISHLIEMKPKGLQVNFPTMHGEKTGVGSILAAREYERIAKVEDPAAWLKPYAPIDPDRCSAFFGPRLIDDILEENRQDCLSAVTPERLSSCWPEIRKILAEIPPSEQLFALLKKLDAKRTLEDIGVSQSDLDRVLEFSPLVRNRLTLMRMRRMITF